MLRWWQLPTSTRYSKLDSSPEKETGDTSGNDPSPSKISQDEAAPFRVHTGQWNGYREVPGSGYSIGN